MQLGLAYVELIITQKFAASIREQRRAARRAARAEKAAATKLARGKVTTWERGWGPVLVGCGRELQPMAA